jgi:hypothetical protein
MASGNGKRKGIDGRYDKRIKDITFLTERILETAFATFPRLMLMEK